MEHLEEQFRFPAESIHVLPQHDVELSTKLIHIELYLVTLFFGIGMPHPKLTTIGRNYF